MGSCMGLTERKIFLRCLNYFCEIGQLLFGLNKPVMENCEVYSKVQFRAYLCGKCVSGTFYLVIN